MKAVSLFAGVGGFDLALERNGVEVVASVEIDKNARKILTRHFPKSQILEDVKDVTGEQLFRFGFNSDGIIVGGFPCQDLSVAGKRKGLAGERSGLFWEIHRLLDETKAKYFILENVPGLLSSNGGKDLGIVLGSLAELGYGIAYRVLDAQFFGVPQRRRRVFIVGCLGDDGRTPAEILAICESSKWNIKESEPQRQNTSTDVTDSVTAGFGQSSFAGYSEGLTTLTATSNKRPEENIVISKLSTLRSAGGDVGGGSENLIVSFAKSRRAQNSEDFETWIEGAVAPTLNRFENNGDTRATVIVFDPHRADGVRIQNETMNTLTGYMGTGKNNMPMVGSEFTVRRITPIECERLQGFPDNWTEGQTDGHRYKQMGNAVAVPVVEWIIRRLVSQ
jgi:DNA (cytosine-5)-methyltransferase 1